MESVSFEQCPLIPVSPDRACPLSLTALATGYLIYSWGMQEFERLKRKNPADYDHEQ